MTKEFVCSISPRTIHTTGNISSITDNDLEQMQDAQEIALEQLKNLNDIHSNFLSEQEKNKLLKRGETVEKIVNLSKCKDFFALSENVFKFEEEITVNHFSICNIGNANTEDYKALGLEKSPEPSNISNKTNSKTDPSKNTTLLHPVEIL